MCVHVKGQLLFILDIVEYIYDMEAFQEILWTSATGFFQQNSFFSAVNILTFCLLVDNLEPL